MASISSPPFSAPATLERRQKAKGRNWLRSAKEVFTKPWKKPSKRPKKQPVRPPLPQHNPQKQMPAFKFADLQATIEDTDSTHGNIPLPFAGNRLSPDGGSSSPYEERPSKIEIDLPDTTYGSRPPLSNIFEINLKSKNTTSSKPAVSQTTPAKQAPPTKNAPPMTTPTNMSSPAPSATTPPTAITPPNATTPTQPGLPTYLAPPISSRPLEERRHSTPITSSLSAPTTPRDHRRPSASSDITIDKLRNHRRERRSSATRELPMLPKRGQDPFQCSSHSSTMSTPPEPSVSPYSEYSGLYMPYQHLPTDPSDPHLAAAMMGLPTSYQRPPVGPGGGVQVEMQPQQQVLLPPHAQLQELQEELDDDDEPDGAENFLTRIEEIEEVDYQHPPRLSNPIAEGRRLPVELEKHKPQKSKPSVSDIGGKQGGSRLSNKKSGQNKKGKQEGNTPAILKAPKEADPEFKGFDGFFMY